MIGIVVLIFTGIIIFEFIIFGLKYLLDGSDANAEYYRLCEDCPTGFCMEEPGSEECEKIRRKFDNEV